MTPNSICLPLHSLSKDYVVFLCCCCCDSQPLLAFAFGEVKYRQTNDMTNFVVSARGVVCALTFDHRKLVSQLGFPSTRGLSDWHLHVRSLRIRKDTCRQFLKRTQPSGPTRAISGGLPQNVIRVTKRLISRWSFYNRRKTIYRLVTSASFSISKAGMSTLLHPVMTRE
jgi:hypothetical protein